MGAFARRRGDSQRGRRGRFGFVFGISAAVASSTALKGLDGFSLPVGILTLWIVSALIAQRFRDVGLPGWLVVGLCGCVLSSVGLFGEFYVLAVFVIGANVPGAQYANLYGARPRRLGWGSNEGRLCRERPRLVAIVTGLVLATLAGAFVGGLHLQLSGFR